MTFGKSQLGGKSIERDASRLRVLLGSIALPPVALGGDPLGGIIFIIEGGGSAITTGIKGDIEVPFACSINRATLLADQTGSIVVDIWKDSYGNFPPDNADSITASAPPTISSATKSQDTTLSGWNLTINAGDVLRFNVDSATTVTRVTLSLKVTLV